MLVLLVPLLIIRVLFEWVGMDLVGLLPKSARHHEYTLVILNNATRYLGGDPSMEGKVRQYRLGAGPVAQLGGDFKRHPHGQGTPFVTWLIQDLCQLLLVKHLRMSVYHPQTDGLVEQFNKTQTIQMSTPPYRH